MAFTCECCTKSCGERERPVTVVTAVKLNNDGAGYNTVEELRMCMACAVTTTNVSPRILKERSSVQSEKVRKALADYGFRVKTYDPPTEAELAAVRPAS